MKYLVKTNAIISHLNWEQKQYHGDIDMLKEGFVDWEKAEWDGLGITYESVRQCSCSDCGEKVSELELRLFRKHSKVEEDLCKDCHSKSTANLNISLPCFLATLPSSNIISFPNPVLLTLDFVKA